MNQVNAGKSTKRRDYQITQNKNEYGLDSRTNMMSRFRFTLENDANRTPRESSAPHTNINIPSSRISQAASSRLKAEKDEEAQSEQYFQTKIQPYKEHILTLIKENQSLKLKHRQAEIRASQLEMKIQMGGSSLRESTVDRKSTKAYGDLSMTTTLIGKYQLPIRRALQLYGYSREESNIDACRSQADIISFLVKFISDRWQQIHTKESEAREELAREQRQMAKIRQSLRKLMDSNELFKGRENKYKEKMEEAKKQWLLVCDKLKKSQESRQILQNDKMTLEKCILEYENELLKFQKEKKDMVEGFQREVNEKQTRIVELNGQISKLQIKCEQMQRDYEDCFDTIEQWKIRCRVKDGELERMTHDMHRWKERYQQSERSKLSIVSDQVKIPVDIKRNLYTPASSKIPLEPIQERSTQGQMSKEVSYPIDIHSQFSTPIHSSHPYEDVNLSKDYREPPLKNHENSSETILQLENVMNALQKQFDRKIKK